MRIAVFGLGYVGSVSAACLAARGHDVVGVDPDPKKTQAVSEGRAPQSEPGLDELIARGMADGRLRVAATAAEGVAGSDLALVCVGTPSRPGGALDLSAVERVSREIGAAVGDRPYAVVIRSTSLPGTLSRVGSWIEEAGGTRVQLATNPEFLREGTAIEDFERPPFTVVGTGSEELAETLREVYAGVEAPFFHVEPGVAAALKYACNSFHAVKVTFANEIGRFCRSFGVDSRKVMEVFCEDTELNVSKRYLRPGFSYGGSCLPKDVRALTSAARHRDVEVPLLSSLEPSNRIPVEEALHAVLSFGHTRIGVVGLSFKSMTDDMRESPFLELVERLAGKGLELRIFDPDVRWQDVFGSNREFVLRELPHVAELLVPELTALGERDVVILGKDVPGLLDYLGRLPGPALVLDLVGAVEDPGALPHAYRGIAW